MQLNQETKPQPQKTEKFVNAISESARNWIFVELNNKRKKILVDTGAARTVIDLAMLQSLGLERENLTKNWH